MHSAPPVLVPVGRFVWGGRIALMLALLTALVWLVLARMQAMSAARMALLALATLALKTFVEWRASAESAALRTGESS